MRRRPFPIIVVLFLAGVALAGVGAFSRTQGPKASVRMEDLVGRRSRDGDTHRLERQPGSVSCVTDAEKRLRDRLSLLHVSLPATRRGACPRCRCR